MRPVFNKDEIYSIMRMARAGDLLANRMLGVLLEAAQKGEIKDSIASLIEETHKELELIKK